MINSLLIKLGMLAATMGLVFWIGWKAPAGSSSPVPGPDRPAEGPLPSGPPAAVVNAPVPARTDASAVQEAPSEARKQKLDINQATVEHLELLPGIGSVLAERVVAHRRSVGGFRNIDELRHVKGIGAKKFERIRPLVTVTPPKSSQPSKRAA